MLLHLVYEPSQRDVILPGGDGDGGTRSPNLLVSDESAIILCVVSGWGLGRPLQT